MTEKKGIKKSEEKATTKPGASDSLKTHEKASGPA
jgi:hypothetical protein